jgi:hypothetical protein
MKEKTTDSLYAGAAGTPVTSKVVPVKLEKVPMVRTITDVTGMSPRRIKNGNTLHNSNKYVSASLNKQAEIGKLMPNLYAITQELWDMVFSMKSYIMRTTGHVSESCQYFMILFVRSFPIRNDT